ncbi:arabinosyltransferase domain-containing protein [Nocardia bovistercoris]|uniref:Arabinosyltransferase domain-containing protein n=1 Tax=Nocardia bovistercoris TaxID=2785916 RepID=A0A931N5W0_9NOCA|nr:arabinosyltransferase domain-containing protein [Nocardia bovistercoris]MBH0780127.1 arabinosyltransferase domain-containing protein [Nocardia bovistercoris]
MVRTGEPSAVESGPGTVRRDARGGWARPVALIAALVGALCAIAVPLLPVRVDAATLSWPQAGSARAVEAPLVAYAPLTYDATIPCAAITGLAPRGGLLTATAPDGAPDLDRYGFVARVIPATDTATARFDAVLRDRALFDLPVDALAPNCVFTVHAEATSSTATLTGAEPVRLTGDLRPQLVGVFSDLAAADGTRVVAELDTRFSSTPTPVKRIALWVAVAATLIALVALFRLDRLDGRGARRFLPRRWWSFSLVDAVVFGTLAIWHVIGSTTSDDGYQFGMGRAARASGYMANYFRYFGVPETPIGTPYYDVIGWMSQVSVASPWMRLPALSAAVLTWLIISREVVPRLGVAVRRDRVALWTGALVFLAVWLPYNNGLRPEPYVALGVLLTWCSVERGIATRRLLPFAVAILIAAFSCTAGPHGVICVAALLAGLRPLARAIAARARTVGWLPLVAPLGAAGTVVLTVAFADQPLSAMFEMRRVHEIAGPNVKWYDEYLRYQYLFMSTVDGSVARRFGIFVMLAGLLVCLVTLLHKGGRIPSASLGPSRRIIGVTVGALLFMMTTPTKWTHHLGVFAGLAGVVAVLTAVAVGPKVMRAPRNRALFASGVAFLLALVFSGPNGWWYVSAYSIPWWDKRPSVAGIGVNQVFLLAALALAALAAWWHVRAPGPGITHRVTGPGRWFTALHPLTIAAAALVAFEVLSFAKGAVTQYPAFSLARSNIDAMAGHECGLSRHVLVETDPNAGMLAPLSGAAAATLAGTGAGFTPNGVAGDLSADAQEGADAAIASSVDAEPGAETETGTSGAALPFGLDPATPVLGTDGTTEPASLTTGWYRLPEGADRAGLVAISAAGRIRSVDADGVQTPGQPLEIEYGTFDGGVATPAGRVTPIDIGPAPSWRNLRLPIDEIPSNVSLIRIVASDRDRDPKQWLAITPPRVPRTSTLQQVVGDSDPVLLDWAVGLQFPCQRPFDHRIGIAEVPKYRILPDRVGAHDTTLWQNHDGGGPLGWTPLLLESTTMATYLNDDWRRDWGELQRFTRRAPDAVPARPEVVERARNGWWTPGHINAAW